MNKDSLQSIKLKLLSEWRSRTGKTAIFLCIVYSIGSMGYSLYFEDKKWADDESLRLGILSALFGIGCVWAGLVSMQDAWIRFFRIKLTFPFWVIVPTSGLFAILPGLLGLIAVIKNLWILFFAVFAVGLLAWIASAIYATFRLFPKMMTTLLILICILFGFEIIDGFDVAKLLVVIKMAMVANFAIYLTGIAVILILIFGFLIKNFFTPKSKKSGKTDCELKTVPIGNSTKITNEDRWQDRISFHDQQSGLIAVFHDWWEYRMGAYHWGLSLFDGEKDISAEHVDVTLNDEKSPKRYQRPSNYQPWAMDGDVLALLPKENTWLSFYFPRKRQLQDIPHLTRVSGLVCSPKIPRIAISRGTEKVQLVNLDGHLITDLPIQGLEPGHPPFLAWLEDGHHLISISKHPLFQETTLILFDGKTGAVLTTTTINPIDLVPYDHEKFKVIDRERGFPLITSPNSGSMGRLLDEWNEIKLENQDDILQLEIYRPVGDLLPWDSGTSPQDLGPVVRVERRQIRVRLQITSSG
jgi:hypothetical protein